MAQFFVAMSTKFVRGIGVLVLAMFATEIANVARRLDMMTLDMVSEVSSYGKGLAASKAFVSGHFVAVTGFQAQHQ